MTPKQIQLIKTLIREIEYLEYVLFTYNSLTVDKKTEGKSLIATYENLQEVIMLYKKNALEKLNNEVVNERTDSQT